MSFLRYASTRGLVGVAVALLAGCTSPVQISLEEPTAPVRAPAAARTVFTLEPIVDMRPASSRDNAGHVGGRTLQAAGALAWVEKSLLGLSGRSYVMQPASDSQSAWRVQGRLHQFYAASLDISKNAQVVVELEFHHPKIATFTRVYRGRVNAMNWWNSSGEIDGAIRAAAEDCFNRIASDLEKIATSPPATE